MTINEARPAMEWRNHVAAVTGGSRGIGRATARLLAQRGAAVCVNYAVHADAAEALVAEIATAGGRAIALGADVADSAAVEAMVARTQAELGPVTILVNNAGVAWQGTLDTYDREQVARMHHEPEDIANAVVFLAAPESGWITAQVLTVDGERMDYIGHG